MPGSVDRGTTQCTALYVSNSERCQETATSVNGLFCSFHSKQCQGLYKGYKNRNARLDALNSSAPDFFASSSTPLANQTFVDVKSEATLDEIHKHLYLKHALLDRVIRARKLHHSHFFSMIMDYGHQHYLDILQSQKHIVVGALERLERRTAEVLYKQQKWFKWVRERQNREEQQRDNESKRIKREAQLFKRHWKEMEARMKQLRAKEEAQRQEEYLERIYNERKSQEGEAADSEWDPIEEVVENNRGNFIELIKHFLWQDLAETQSPEVASKPEGADDAQGEELTVATKATKGSKNKKKPKDTQASQEPKGVAEARAEMRLRLKEGSAFQYGTQPIVGVLHGSIECPVELDKTPPLPEAEIDGLLEEIGEIKHLLFCRLLLSHATLLPAALKANSVEDFLLDQEISTADLRDLCLKMEKPDLQDIRDACADLARGEEEASLDESEDDNELQVGSKEKNEFQVPFRKKTGALPNSWQSKQEKLLQKRKKMKQSLGHEEEQGMFIDFGVIDDEGDYKRKKMRVKICGRSIWNYRSERALTHEGWFHFSIIAKDSNLYDAVKLCRHWDEFFELNILAIYHYFPAANWLEWAGDRLRVQLLQLGVIPYSQFTEADVATLHQQTGSRGGGRRMHSMVEARNYVCAHIKRNDAASRRLIQYLSMQANDMVLLVRDAKSGRILVKPPEEERWIIREKSGVGRASKNEWNVLKRVGPELFKEVEDHRKWHFGFTEYYDIWIWDYEAGQCYSRLYNGIQELLIKAHRFCTGLDLYNLSAPVLKTLTRDPTSHRVRKLKPGETLLSLDGQIHSDETRFVFANATTGQEESPNKLFYNQADMLEDQVLFPEESQEDPSKAPFREPTGGLSKFENEGINFGRFVLDLDSDLDEFDREHEQYEDTYIDDHEHEEEDEDEDGEDEDDEDDEDEDDDELSEDDDSAMEDTKNGHANDSLLAKALSSLGIRAAAKGASKAPEERTALERHVPSKELQTYIDNWVNSKSSYYDDLPMVDQFQDFMDREKAAVFKESFHKADLQPGAQEQYREMCSMTKKMRRHMVPHDAETMEIFTLIGWMELTPLMHLRVLRDMANAHAMMSLFFPSDFFDSESGMEYKDSLLIIQVERMRRGPPDRRTHTSNKYLPKEFFRELDERPGRFFQDKIPPDWDVVARPIIARLFKEGVIGPSRLQEVAGTILVHQEPHRNTKDLYFDFRGTIDTIVLPPILQDPRISTSSLRSSIRLFASKHPGARFAVLRVWSAPHFYPLMLGFDKRDNHSFVDAIGRSWEWKFIPKDMPCSEWSIHHHVRMRLQPWMHLFKGKLEVRRDLIVVMGTGEADLKRLVTAVGYAVVTKPWRLEVDLWRSFVNVDGEFVEGVGDGWLD